jgi:ATP-dependent Zn protease
MIDNQTKQAIAEALKLLSDNNSSTRIEAVKRLGIIGVAHPQIIERLQSIALNDVSPDVRNAANMSLEMLQPPPVNKSVVATYQEQQSSVSLTNEKSIIELLQKQNEILESLRVLIFNSTESQTNKQYRLRTRIADIDMSISSMVNLMIKWVIASIPAAIIIGIMFFFFSAILSGCFAALGQ